jgi:hypothetical protein
LAIRAATWRNPAAGRAAARFANHPLLYADECAAWRLQTTTPFGGEPWRTKRLRRLQAQALQRNGPARRLSDNSKQEELVMDGKSLLIGVLLVGMGVLGYLYWDSQHNTVVKLPGVEIKKN